MRRIYLGSIIFILAFFLVSFAPLLANAQDIGARRFKVGMAVNLGWSELDYKDLDISADTDTFLVALDMGYFITDMFEIGPEVAYFKTKTESEKSTIWSLVLNGNAHFNMDNMIVPYIGLRIGFSSVDMGYDQDDTAFIYGAQLGMDYFINQNVSVNPEIRYTRASYDFNGDDVDMDDISLMIGFGIHF